MRFLRTLAIGLLLCLTGCECHFSSNDKYDYRELGRRSHRAGAPANANPAKFDKDSREWMEGWLEEQEKAKAIEK